MLQQYATVFCGVWMVGGLILTHISPKTHLIGLVALIGGSIGLAITLSY